MVYFAIGSTGIIEIDSPGIVLKIPHIPRGKTESNQLVKDAFSAEKKILARIGQHPRVVKFLGIRGDAILLGQATHGNLQTYIDEQLDTSLEQRLVWCRQLAEGIDYIHSQGVVHCDLRPENILVHETSPGARDLQLCDFGGAMCEDLGEAGTQLPDPPFCNPDWETQKSEMMDIFGMGSIFYTILTGRWPYKETPGRFKTIEELLDWEDNVAMPSFKAGKFPDVKDLPLGDVMLRCWKIEFETAADALAAVVAALP